MDEGFNSIKKPPGDSSGLPGGFKERVKRLGIRSFSTMSPRQYSNKVLTVLYSFFASSDPGAELYCIFLFPLKFFLKCPIEL